MIQRADESNFGQQEMKRKARVRRDRRSARLLDPDKPKIVFANPDILFLILGLQCQAEPFEALRRYETLILDEFHLYQQHFIISKIIHWQQDRKLPAHGESDE